MKKSYLHLFFYLLFFSCDPSMNIEKTTFNKLVLPEMIHEGDTIIVNLISDSVNIIEDSLFFNIELIMQDMQTLRGYLAIKNNQAFFIIPKGAASLKGFFYNIEEKDKNNFYRLIYKKNSNTTVPNAFTLNRNQKNFLEKELHNNPNNSIAYATYIGSRAGKYYLGEISDSVFNKEVKKYISIVESKYSEESINSLYALATLYSYDKQYNEVKKVLTRMIREYPNSYLTNDLFTTYSFAVSLDKDYPKNDTFIDSLKSVVAREMPYSKLGIYNLQSFMFSTNKKYYSDEALNNIAIFWLKNIDSTSFDAREALIQADINQKNYKKARDKAQKFLEDIYKDLRQHYIPSNLEEIKKKNEAGKEYFVVKASIMLSDIELKLNNSQHAIYLLDTAYNYYSQRNNSDFIKSLLRIKKASIQRKINQHNEALKTYETLYQETKDDRVLDSIKVLFKETQQEKGFEIYAKNLKEKVENKKQEPKKLAADFSIKDMSGYEIKLSEWKGRVVVLNFWANYCLPCAKEIPYINKIWRETQTKDIIFLAVTKNTPIEVTRFAQRQKEIFSFSILPNAKELFDVNDIHLVPTTIVINKKGEIVHKESGFGGNIDKLKQVVLEELAK